MDVPQIDVLEHDFAAGAGLRDIVLDDSAIDVCRARGRDRGRVVGPGDGYGDDLRDLAALAVVDGDLE